MTSAILTVGVGPVGLAFWLAALVLPTNFIDVWPDDFSALTACEGQRIELRCPRAQFIAMRSAVFGWANAFHMDAECSHRRLPSAADQGCRLSCVLQTIVNQCDGRRRCSIDASTTVFGSRCSPSATKFLAVLHTCVPRAVQRALDSDDDLSTLADPCGNSQFGDFPRPDIITRPTTTSSTTSATTQAEFWWHPNPYNPSTTTTERVYIRDPVWRSQLSTTSSPRYSRTLMPSDHANHAVQHGVQVSGTRRRPDVKVFALEDWIWTWQFANENKEKFVLYMVIGLCFGTITILIAVLFQFAVRQQGATASPSGTARRTKVGAGRGGGGDGLGSSCGSPTWRDGTGHGMPESESSTGDDRTLHDVEDVELTAFNRHVDSLPRRPAAAVAPTPTVSGGGTATRCLHQPGPSAYASVARPGSSMGVAAPTANINRSYATISAGRCHTPAGLAHHHHQHHQGPPSLQGNGGMTLGHVPNGYGGTGVRYTALPSSAAGIGHTPAGGAATSQGGPGGSMVVHRGPMIGSLNRSYAGNQYGPLHDFSYMSAGDGGSMPGSVTGGPGVGAGQRADRADTSTPVSKTLHQPIGQPHFYD